ncbi:MAG: RlmE family RNA methyltransferase [Desulfobulbaceae bacterium]|uniref:Ribosomal RNA large subunit methyltransferase E n=1 Tax=Candidatus Desulfobia pelagia TaxID=2841692 RepID=A0A8J6NDR4_9BACT|nr:RlmE family RNA methyltransferase [Candidatus Desulfobia pelagia]
MRKIQDHYFQKARKDKYPARSVYKLEEAQKKHRFLKTGDKVLDLGCHPGSWSMYAAKIIGANGRVVGVDLQASAHPAVKGGAPITLLQGDICDPGVIEVLDAKGPFHAVVSDMAPKTTGNKFSDHVRSVELSHNALTIASQVLIQGGNFYCKVFQGEDFQSFVVEVKKLFRQVKIIKPKSSREESREVFVLGVGYRGKTEISGGLK